MRKNNIGICYNMPSRQYMDSLDATSTEPLNGSSVEGLEKKLVGLHDNIKQVSEIILVLLKKFYKGDSDLLNKILYLYRTDCTFRKSVRDATLLALFNSGYGFSLYRDAKCTSKLDKFIAIATTSGLIADIVKIVGIYNKKPDDPKLGSDFSPGIST